VARLENVVNTADLHSQAHQTDSSGNESEPESEHSLASGDAKSAAYKVILATPGTSSIPLVWINLIAVALGTIKMLAWVAAIGLAIFGGLFGGMLKAGFRQGRRNW
jgi:hypothetical protein